VDQRNTIIKKIFAGLATNVRKFKFKELKNECASTFQLNSKNSNENHNRDAFNSGVNISILSKRTDGGNHCGESIDLNLI